MRERKIVNRSETSGSELGAPADGAAPQAAKGTKAWLWGAYTFLFVWGMAYLVLFFTDRLPT